MHYLICLEKKVDKRTYTLFLYFLKKPIERSRGILKILNPKYPNTAQDPDVDILMLHHCCHKDLIRISPKYAATALHDPIKKDTQVCFLDLDILCATKTARQKNLTSCQAAHISFFSPYLLRIITGQLPQ